MATKSIQLRLREMADDAREMELRLAMCEQALRSVRKMAKAGKTVDSERLLMTLGAVDMDEEGK